MAGMSATKTTELISVEPLVDRISELPWEILDNILGRLPIKNAGATTILSRKWKGKWVDVSKIVLDDYSNETGIMDSKLFSRLVYHVLLSHRGTIEEFTLASHDSDSVELEHLIYFLGRCDIKELTFNFTSSYPSICSLFSHCKQLRYLCLINCCFWSLPENVPLFKTLVSLCMTLITCDDEVLEKMINSSLLLENLALQNANFSRLTICAPSLRYLSLEGEFKNVYLETCPLLNDASFKMTAKVEEISDGLIQPPYWLSQMRRLVMSGFFLKFLAERYKLLGASIDCLNLEVLELDTVNLDDFDERAIAFSILTSSSNLNILRIMGFETYYAEDFHRFVGSRFQRESCFNKLRLARITIYRRDKVIDMFSSHIPSVMLGSESKVCSFTELIGILLFNSPVLENMHIHYGYLEIDDIWFMKKLVSYKRASSQLKLTYTSARGHYFT